jgi:hypothetical protein
MHKHKVLLWMAMVAWLASSSAVASPVKDATWPVYRGDSLEYYASRLPDPIVIFVLSSNARLVGILDPHGHLDKGSLDELAGLIASKRFARLADGTRVSTDALLRNYLLDQGYRMGDIVHRDTPFTLLLVMQTVKKTDCQAYADLEARFKNRIRRAVEDGNVDQPFYSVALLEVGSPKSTIKCK